MVSKGKRAAYKIKHANILLKADADGPNWTDEAIAEAFSVHVNTVRNLRQRFVERGMDGALTRKQQSEPSRKRLLDGEKEAHLIAIACSTVPEGRTGWTLQLLATRSAWLNIVETISYETVRRTLKKMNYNRI
jgi:transposase